jgi:hypothetical protein
MRDFRDAKAMARTLRAALAAKSHKVSIAESLELVAKAFGVADWNTLSAVIQTAEADKAAEPSRPLFDNNAHLDRLATAVGWSDWDALIAALRSVRADQPGRRTPPDQPALPIPAPPGDPARRAGRSFSKPLEVTLHKAVGLANARKHGYTTLEHLLLALTDDPEATPVMEACQVDVGALKATLASYVDNDLQRLMEMGDRENAGPTAGFHRVIQRAVIHVQATDRPEVTSANVLVAMFSERESHACAFLENQGMTRFDAVNFIAHGMRNNGGRPKLP